MYGNLHKLQRNTAIMDSLQQIDAEIKKTKAILRRQRLTLALDFATVLFYLNGEIRALFEWDAPLVFTLFFALGGTTLFFASKRVELLRLGRGIMIELENIRSEHLARLKNGINI